MTTAIEGRDFLVLQSLFVIHVDHGVPRWRRSGAAMRLRVHQNYFTALEELEMHYSNAKSFLDRIYPAENGNENEDDEDDEEESNH